MDSFYGGQPGSSFIVAAHFSDFNELEKNFKDLTYKEVRYGEYAIIDNRGNSHNGDIYRRDPEGPTYIANISGPAGGAVPTFHWSTKAWKAIILKIIANIMI